MNSIFRTLILAISCFAVTTAYTSSPGEPSVVITIHPDRVIGKIPETIYGHFLEHINHSINGGLWGEAVWNRSFEESTTGTAKEKQPGRLSRWAIIGKAMVSIDSLNALNGKKSIKIIANGTDAGIAQGNFFLRKGDALKGSLWLKGKSAQGITVQLVSGKTVLARQVITKAAAGWKEFPLVLLPKASADSAVLEIFTSGTAQIWLDQVSLMPNSSRATGGFRPDLLKAIADLKPTSIRWPGGGFANGYNWKNGIGPQQKRTGKGRPNDIDPLALGLDEFMTLCKKVGAAPIMCLPLGRRDNSELSHYIQEALDELEYCNGSIYTKWGKVRAENGHPEPYNIKYWEIDNELYLSSMTAPDYLKAVDAFADALHQKDATLKIIGCGGGGTSLESDKGWSLKMLSGDLSKWDYFSLHQYENYSRRQGKFDSLKFRTGVTDFEKYYAELRGRIAGTNRKDMKVYESEWNYMSIDWRTGLYAGGLLNCFERNGDLVPMACPALFLRHTSSAGWDNALINFDHKTWFPAPNYVVMKLYRDHFAPNRIAIDGDNGPLNIIATKTDDGNMLMVKMVNPFEKETAVVVTIPDSFSVLDADIYMVSGQLNAKNSLDHPDKIAVIKKKVEVNKNVLKYVMPAFSVAVMEVPGKQPSK